MVNQTTIDKAQYDWSVSGRFIEISHRVKDVGSRTVSTVSRQCDFVAPNSKYQYTLIMIMTRATCYTLMPQINSQY